MESRRLSTDSEADNGASLSAVISETSIASVSKAPPPTPRTTNGRNPSAHSLLAANPGADLRHGARPETNRTSMDRPSISMPPPTSKPAADRRLSQSLASVMSTRKSDDIARSPPSSVKSLDDRQIGTSPQISTTAMDTTSITAVSGIPTMNGTPSLSPPPVSPIAADVVSLPSSKAPSSNESNKPEKTITKELMSQAPSLINSAKSEALSEGALPTRAPRPSKPRSTSSNRRFSGTGSRQDLDEIDSQASVGKIGVCALDIKARSRPSRQILTRLQGNGEFEVIVFGDKVILDEDVENWPICDFLISFFSDGFPLDKAIAYWKIRKPFLVNDLMMQKVLWDRRLCLQILDRLKVPTPARIEVTRDGGPRLESADLAQHVKSMSGVTLPGPDNGTGGGVISTTSVYMADIDTLVVDGKIFKKPFVEKPVSGEDHNVIIYFHSSEGGGGRRLFRKIGNKSSEFDPDLVVPRCIDEPGSSYIYEQFLKVEKLEDVKAYTVGTEYCHAETRKSPVVDGLVRRNTHGKELRYVTKLTDDERKMAARVARGFGQRICGFDLLRTGVGSFVIDVNGWSFVKDNEAYYNDCANILRSLFFSTKYRSDFGTEESSPADTPSESVSGHSKHSHRQVLKKLLKSPSMSKLSAHVHSSHSPGTSSPRQGSITAPISSPPSVERPNSGLVSVPIIDKGDLLPPPIENSGLNITGDLSTPILPPPSIPNEKVESSAPMPSSKHSWKLKGVVTVIRHADRTPKQKIKFTAHSQVFVDLLKGHHEEVLLKGPTALASVENAVKVAIQQKLEDPEKLRNLRNALARKGGQPDTKVQIKPMFRKRKPEEMKAISVVISNGAQPTSGTTTQLEQSPTVDAPTQVIGDLSPVQARSNSVSGVTFSRFSAAENDLVLDKLQLVMKWGGEPTHSARYQSQDLGANMRDDYMLMNREVLSDVHIFTSSEKRVRTSAQIFAASFLNRQDLPDDFISVRKDLLDDSNAAKDVMDKVKKKLKHLLREGNSVPEQFAWPKDVNEPYVVMQRVVDLLRFNRRVMRYNFKKLGSGAAASLAAIHSPDETKEDRNIDIATIQARWCTGEDAELFKERWEKLFSEFCDSEKADPSKISELYDTMKYDALHNKQFLEWVFTPSQAIIEEIKREEAALSATVSPASEQADDSAPNNDKVDGSSTLATNSHDGKHSLAHKIGLRRRSVLTQPPSTPPLTSSEQDASYFKLFSGSGDSRSKQDKRLGRLRELYRLAKILFDYIGPQEYGISDEEKLEIGLLTSLPLLREIVQDLEELQASGDAQSFVYFTKESHIYTLLNCIMEGGIHTKIKRATIPELDYLSQICFELYEARDSEAEKSTYSIRISISPGCHTIDPLDVSLDSKHAIGSAARRSLTNHQDWQEVISTLKAKFDTVQLPKSFLAINVSDKHEQEAEEAKSKAAESEASVKPTTVSATTEKAT